MRLFFIVEVLSILSLVCSGENARSPRGSSHKPYCFTELLYDSRPFIILNCTGGVLEVIPCKYGSDEFKSVTYYCGNTTEVEINLGETSKTFAENPGSVCNVSGFYQKDSAFSEEKSPLESKSCTVTTLDIVNSTGSYTVFRPDNTTLTCGTILNSYPTAVDIQWLHNNTLVYDSDQYKYSNHSNNVRLHISETTLKDNGNWTCKISNGPENIKLQMVLYVNSLPSEPLNLTEISHTSTIVNISWQPPLCEGSPAFDDYEVEITSDDTGFSDTQTTDSTTLHCVFDNLAPGTQYNFTVNAVIREFDRRGPPSKKLMLTTDAVPTNRSNTVKKRTSSSKIPIIIVPISCVFLGLLILLTVGGCMAYKIVKFRKTVNVVHVYEDIEDFRNFEFIEHYVDTHYSLPLYPSMVSVINDSNSNNIYETITDTVSNKQDFMNLKAPASSAMDTSDVESERVNDKECEQSCTHSANGEELANPENAKSEPSVANHEPVTLTDDADEELTESLEKRADSALDHTSSHYHEESTSTSDGYIAHLLLDSGVVDVNKLHGYVEDS